MKVSSPQDSKKEYLRLERNETSRFEQKIGELKQKQQQALELQKESHEDLISEKERLYQNRLKENKVKHENKLKALQDNFDSTTRFLEQERTNLIERHAQEVDEFKDHSTRKNEELFSDQKDFQDSQIEAFQKKQQRLNNDYTQKVKKMKDLHYQEIKNLYAQNQRHLLEKRNDFDQTYSENELKFQNRLHQQEVFQENTLKELNQKFSKDMQRLQLEHQNQYQVQMDRFQKVLNAAQKDFEVRFGEIQELHDQNLHQLINESKQKLADVKNSLIENESLYFSKVKDSFYHPSILEPEIKDLNDKYLISVEVDPQEENLIHLYAHGRNIRLTRSRDFQDSVTQKNGDINKFHRTESYSKSFNVGDIVNGKKIERIFENGKLTFILPKS